MREKPTIKFCASSVIDVPLARVDMSSLTASDPKHIKPDQAALIATELDTHQIDLPICRRVLIRIAARL